MELTLIAAIARNGIIGRDGGLPWRLPDDLAHFKRHTSGHTIIMGRKTWLSIGRPLPKRTNVVLSRSTAFAVPQGVLVYPKLGDAIEAARAAGESEAFVIGGASIYAEALPQATRLELTRVHADVDGDVQFPECDFSGFERVSISDHASDERHAHAFSFERWERR